jgi:hypothetical protein
MLSDAARCWSIFLISRAALSEVSRLVKDYGFFVLTTQYHGLCKNLTISLTLRTAL